MCYRCELLDTVIVQEIDRAIATAIFGFVRTEKLDLVTAVDKAREVAVDKAREQVAEDGFEQDIAGMPFVAYVDSRVTFVGGRIAEKVDEMLSLVAALKPDVPDSPAGL